MGKIAIVTTIDMSLDVLFPDFFPLLQKRGHEVVGVCATTGDGEHVRNVTSQGVRVHELDMTRGLSPHRDAIALGKMWRFFRKEKFDLIHYSTPKAALLASMAARASGDAYRLYTLRGLGYTGFQGTVRRVGKLAERVACGLAHQVLAISPSLAQEALAEGVVGAEKLMVLGAGSSRGVDLHKFSMTEDLQERSKEVRGELGVSGDALVIGYAGRLSEEKGIEELYQSFLKIEAEGTPVHLLCVGSKDLRNPVSSELLQLLQQHPRIHLKPFTHDLPVFLACMDLLVLPSHREGFGNILIEASAMAIPVVASDIPGCQDAVEDGETGFLFPAKDVDALTTVLRKLCDEKIRAHLGSQGRKRVEREFDRQIVWARLIEQYEKAL